LDCKNYIKRNMSVGVTNFGGTLYVGANMVKSGLVVHLDPRNPKSYGGSGAVITDISPEGVQRDATFSGTYTISSDGIYTDGISGIGSFGQPSITYNNGAGIVQQFSIGYFIKPDNDSGFILSPASFGADHFTNYSISNSGRAGIQTTQSTDVGNRQRYSTNGSVPPLGEWRYFLCTVNDLEVKIYINGILNFSITNDVGIANWTGTWSIANRAFGLGQYYRGYLDNIHIYNREISAIEVKQNFDSFKGRYSNLITVD